MLQTIASLLSLRTTKNEELQYVTSNHQENGVETNGFKNYREAELRRVVAALEANSAVLVTGEEDSISTRRRAR